MNKFLFIGNITFLILNYLSLIYELIILRKNYEYKFYNLYSYLFEFQEKIFFYILNKK